MAEDEWVSKLNSLARQMEAIKESTHPSAWREQTQALRAKYLEIAGQPVDRPE